MKKLLLFVVLVTALVGGGYAAANHYKNYQNKKTQDTVAAKQQSEIEESARLQPFRDKVAELKKDYNSQVVECQKGLAAYGKLTTFTQSQTPQPVCGKKISQN